MRYLRLRYLIAISALGWATATCHGDILVTAVESGGNVIFSGSGTADLSGLAPGANIGINRFIIPNEAEVLIGGEGSLLDADAYSISAGPSSFGSGGFNFATDSTGDRFGINLNPFEDTQLILPDGYISGSQLAGTATFAGQTFASLGLAEGTYVWEWAAAGVTGGTDTFTLTIGNAVPEPGTAFLGSVMGGVGLLMLRRRRR